MGGGWTVAVTFAASMNVEISVTRKNVGTLNTATEPLATGVSGFDAITKSLTTGTGSGQGNRFYAVEATATAGSDTDYDLTSLTDSNGASINFAKIKWFVLVLDAPVTGAYLVWLGTDTGLSNPVTFWKAANTDNTNLNSVNVMTSDVDGWVIDGTHKVLRLNNPTASSITYRMLLVGNV